jgi:uncharacterized protein YkwD
MTFTISPRPASPGHHRRSLAGLATIAALALAVAIPSSVIAADDGGYWAPATFSAQDEQLLVTLTNQARAAAGLPALKVDSALHDMARWRSKDMIDRHYFSHSIPPDGKKVFDYLQASGYCFKVAGENIGTNNFPDDIATQTIQQGFMDSSGHRANILGTGWDSIGIGAYEGPDGQHMWTVLFADKCSTAPAPTPKPTPKPTPSPTPDLPDPVELSGVLGVLPPGLGGGAPDLDQPSPGPEATPVTTAADPDSLQVIDQALAAGLVDTIVGDVAGGFFGN